MLLSLGNASFNNAVKIRETPQAFVAIFDRLLSHSILLKSQPSVHATRLRVNLCRNIV